MADVVTEVRSQLEKLLTPVENPRVARQQSVGA